MALLATTATLLILAIAWLSSRVMGSSFAELERRDVSKNVARASDAIGQKVAELHGKTLDWAIWDDTYQFMKDKNKAYIDSNLSVVNLKLDAILYIDSQGKVFYSRPVAQKEGLKLVNGAELAKELGFSRSVNNRPGKGTPVSGLISHQGVPLMISIRPITKTSGEGVSPGWLIFARYLDSVELKDVAQATHLDIRFLKINGSSIDLEAKQVMSDLTGRASTTRPISDTAISGYKLLTDLYDQPLRVLRTEETRSAFAEGQRSIHFLIKGLVAVAVIFIVVTLFVLERNVMSRLFNLTKQVVEVNDLPNSRMRVEPTGRDEIMLLGNEINVMLANLEAGAQKLRASEEALRHHNENLEAMVAARTSEIEHQAFHDKLTGLPNRALYMDRLSIALEKAKRSPFGTATLFLDLDNFKLVNDSLGHDMGDRLLVEVATRLCRAVRSGDTVARLGGDEFTVLLEDIESAEDTVIIVERILSSLREPIQLGTRETFACASIGIAFTTDPSLGAANLLQNADIAMYRAKANGKTGYVVFEESMLDQAMERLELETDLRRAVESGEIYVNYQPLIDLETGQIIGCEALARWSHAERGFVSPGQFIPIAEETGLIVPIGYWILEEACKQARAWSTEFGLSQFVMSVNLSGKQLQRPDAISMIDGILERTGLSPACLKIELTESVLMEDRTDLIQKMRDLKDLGIDLALDDFGTGYSSLSTLRSFPIDTLKIDRAFISRLGEEDEAMAIVEAIVGMARTMKMDVTGEGVETPAQAEIIRSLGCKTGQGYLFDKPLSTESFTQRLADAFELKVAA
ncbi:MAG: EAL domain-containing protein [Fimbriimonadaceae bacterium]